MNCPLQGQCIHHAITALLAFSKVHLQALPVHCKWRLLSNTHKLQQSRLYTHSRLATYGSNIRIYITLPCFKALRSATTVGQLPKFQYRETRKCRNII